MAFSRYEERSVFRNSRQLYRELFDERGVNFIRHYVTPEFRYPTPEEFKWCQNFSQITYNEYISICDFGCDLIYLKKQ